MNRSIVSAFLIVMVSFSFGCNDSKKTENTFEWNLDREREHNENRNDSTKISQGSWEADIGNIDISGKPLVSGVFPVPEYSLIDTTFNGMGSWGEWGGIDVEDKKIVYHSMYVKSNNINQAFIEDKEDEVFFAIAVLTDSVDQQWFSHTGLSVSSRNYPHFAGQGFVKTKTNKVDFVSFLTADRNAYAIVNMRLFDLRIGRLVLIAPQKDGTLRSLQLDTPVMSYEEMDEHIKMLLKQDEEVIRFFTRANNI